MELDKDVLDHMCASDPLWTRALQLVQLAKKQSSGDDPIYVNAHAASQLMCAIVLLASEAPDPRAILEHCAEGLKQAPLASQT